MCLTQRAESARIQLQLVVAVVGFSHLHEENGMLSSLVLFSISLLLIAELCELGVRGRASRLRQTVASRVPSLFLRCSPRCELRLQLLRDP